MPTPLCPAKLASVIALSLLLLACASSEENAAQQQSQSDAPLAGRKIPNAQDTVQQTLAAKKAEQNNAESNRIRLEVPPDLLATSNARIKAAVASPNANDPTANLTIGSNPPVPPTEITLTPNLIATAPPPTPQRIQVTTHTDALGKTQWLEINADPQIVWQRLSEFWSIQGIELSKYEPQAGLMETKWFSKDALPQDKGTVSRLLSQLTAKRNTLHKYALRLQPQENTTQLHLTYRRRERVTTEPNSQSKIAESKWVERDSTPEQTAQMLNSIASLFSGIAEGNKAVTGS